MTLALIQKLLTAIVILTATYTSFIFFTYHDLIRPIGRSIFNLLPGLLVISSGIALSMVLNNPQLLFQSVFPLKSCFAKGILGTTVLPLVGASIRTLSIIGGLSLVIDKIWFYWRNNYLFRIC